MFSSPMKAGLPVGTAAALIFAALAVVVLKIRAGGDREPESFRTAGSPGGEELAGPTGSRERTGGRDRRRLTVAEQREEIRRIRESATDRSRKRTELWMLLASLDDPAAQVEAANLLAGLVEDHQFELEVGYYLLAPDRPTTVTGAFMRSLQDRPAEVGEAIAADIVRTGSHPLHEQAVRLLERVKEENR